MAVPPGTRIGVYEITAAIGEGGMGQVYRATDTSLGRQVAIKILPDAFASDPDRLARFEREARTLASLSHPHIAAVHGFERSGGANALVMELVEGEDLSRIIARGPMPIDEALAIASQIAEALEAAHEQGIIHRDLKPANIKVKPDGTVKVLDFGLAKAIDPAGSSSVDAMNSPTLSVHATQAGVILGTAAYMSPEQARGRVTDKRTDIWAFGCVLFEMLSGKRGFDGEDATEIIAAVVKSTPDWSALPSSVPPRIVSLIKRCLEKDRKQRASDIAVARFVIGHDTPIDAPPTAVAARRPSRVVAVLAALASVAALALAWPAWTHWREQPPLPKVVRYQVMVPGDIPGTAPISPDGKHLAVIARTASRQQQIWLQSLDSLEARPLAGTEGASDPFWSPDGRFIAFGVAGGINKVSVSGGGVQNVCKLLSPFRGGAWSTSGDILFGSVGNGLMRVASAGGTPSPVTVVAAERKESFHDSPWFLPDGRHFVYSRSAAPGVADKGLGVFVGSLDNTPEQQPKDPIIVGGYGGAFAPSVVNNSGWLLFLQDGVLRAQPFDPRQLRTDGEAVLIADGFSVVPIARMFSVSMDGVVAYRANAAFLDRRLVWFDRTGKTQTSVGDPGQFNTLALSPDGTKAVASRFDAVGAGSGDLWVYDLARGSSTRFTSDPATDWIGVWSRDGQSIAFSSDRSGNGTSDDLYLKPASGAVQETLLPSTPSRDYPQDFSPDGSVLLYSTSSTTTGTGLDIQVLDLKTGKSKPYLQTQFSESQARFSPDGRYVAYASNASGRTEIYVQPYPEVSSGKWMVSVNGGTQPRWRRDGHELFFISFESELIAVDVDTTKGFKAGVPKALFKTPIWGGGVTNNVFRYDVTADGQRFLINTDQGEERGSGVTVVLNWEALLVSKR